MERKILVLIVSPLLAKLTSSIESQFGGRSQILPSIPYAGIHLLATIHLGVCKTQQFAKVHVLTVKGLIRKNPKGWKRMKKGREGIAEAEGSYLRFPRLFADVQSCQVSRESSA